MYKLAIAIVTFLLLLLVGHTQAAELMTSPGAKVKGGLVTDSERAATPLQPRALHGNTHSSPGLQLFAVDVELREDSDGDGYYHRFGVTLDLDLPFDSREIYVVGRLAQRILFQTEPYTVAGVQGSDAYRVDVLLTEGYPAQRYSLSLEVYAADSEQLLQQFGAVEAPALGALYLEDQQQEAVQAQALSIYELAFELSQDWDGDGYYTDLALDLDADAPGRERWVYAEVSLLDTAGYGLPLRTSAPFLLRDYASNDRYRTALTLDYGYSPQAYRLRVDLYDADTHTLLLTGYSPNHTPLYMESLEWDEDAYYSDPGSRHGGSLSLWLLAAFCVLLMLARNARSDK
ncbi:MAG: hypothetical protein CML06_11755 [Pseudomonadales bacterium]|nr:hypothetical protein [Pseudomonadales bacterium]